MRNITSPATRRGSRRAIGLLTGAVLAVVISFAGSTGAYAFNDRLETLFTHFFDCKMLLLSNPAQHTRQCGPSRVVTPFESIASKGDAAAPTVIPTVTEPEEETCEGEWCWCHDKGDEWTPPA